MRKHVCTSGIISVQLFSFLFVDYTEMVGQLRHLNTLDHDGGFPSV